jgi:flavin reductase (DIM6/NTAB) family NADH-FMN oxidoreductase RutF
MAIEATAFRRVAGCFATGVTVVTCRVGERTHGITINSFASLSLDPLLIMICVEHRAIAHDLIPQAGYFAVNVLGQHQREISDYFARRLAPDPSDELRDIPYHLGVSGAPLLDGVIARVEGRLTDVFPGGDHSIFVAEVLAAEICSDEPPLLFHRGKYPRLTPPTIS